MIDEDLKILIKRLTIIISVVFFVLYLFSKFSHKEMNTLDYGYVFRCRPVLSGLMKRCENKEVICYSYSGAGLQCQFKEGKND